LFLHYDHTEVGDAPLGHIIENRAVRTGLFDCLSAIETVRLLAPARLADVEIGIGHARARLDDGTEIEASLLVAADGKTSPLRKRMGIATAEWSYPQTGIVCTMGHERPHEGVAHERFLPSGPFAVLPMTDDPKEGHRSSIVWTERAAAAPAFLALDDEAFSAELAQRFGPYLGAVQVLGERWSYPLSLMHAEKYVLPRFALVGDAAHVIHPIAGQGLNLGLRDVAALSEVLVDAHRLGLDIGAVDTLAKYQRWRRFDNMALAAVTDGLNRLFSNDIGPVQLVRDLGLAAVGRVPAAKKFFMRHAMGTVGKLPRLVRGEPL
jgi:2-octaprenyl-6-methoxyphenol hydroxylase